MTAFFENIMCKTELESWHNITVVNRSLLVWLWCARLNTLENIYSLFCEAFWDIRHKKVQFKCRRVVVSRSTKSRHKHWTRHQNRSNRSFSSDVTAAILVYQNNEMAAILVYGTGISSFLFKYFVLFHHPTGATDHVSENDLLELSNYYNTL